jgi:O-antigen ligase
LYISILLAAEMIIGLSILYDFMRGGFSFFLKNGILARFTGIYDNPNFVGLTTLITTCLIIALFFIEQFNNTKKRILLIVLLLNNFGILLITDSRAAIITVLISSFIMLYLLNKRMLLKVSLSIMIIFLILLFIPIIQDFILILLRPREFTAREYLWNSGIEMFKDHFISGVGPEQFPKFFYTYLSNSALILFEETGALSFGKIPSPHNYFLLMGAENGILGLITSFSIFILFFYLAYRTLKLAKNADMQYYIFAVAVMAIGIGTFLRAFFEISGIMYYGYISRDLPFWIVFIILIFVYQRVKVFDDSKPNIPSPEL